MRRTFARIALFVCLSLTTTVASNLFADPAAPTLSVPPAAKTPAVEALPAASPAVDQKVGDPNAVKPPEAKAEVAVPGSVTALQLELGKTDTSSFTLSGRDARQQLVVTGVLASGALRDVTHHVKYEVSPSGIVTIGKGGLVTPVSEGTATVSITHPSGKTVLTQVHVNQIVQDVPVNFPNQVVPVFTKFACNSGGCHGKASGQNGFRLSLLGFEPTEDFEHLVKEARGRRLFPAAPDRSLLLQKAAGTVPHGGGARIEVDSAPYRILRRWIEQGMPYGNATDPVVTRVELFPRERTLGRNGEQQLVCIAYYSDGQTRDVTSMTQFEPNDPEMATVSETGLVKSNEMTGMVAIMARYQGQVSVFRGIMPMGIVVDNLPPTKNLIDEHVFAQLKTLGLPPSQLCDDATYIRRVSIDITGRLPTAAESEKFVADTNPNKREQLVDSLLASSAYADYFVGKSRAILRNKRHTEAHAHGSF
ncbi:MAG: DUF1549 domain-containing protein, partial [Planctomycetota bacterium]|nr:DUF1549 domain-containing protein [Planctomycetota bacterium]